MIYDLGAAPKVCLVRLAVESRAGGPTQIAQQNPSVQTGELIAKLLSGGRPQILARVGVFEEGAPAAVVHGDHAVNVVRDVGLVLVGKNIEGLSVLKGYRVIEGVGTDGNRVAGSIDQGATLLAGSQVVHFTG